MFDSLRENFEIILIGFFLISTVAYVAYRLTFYKQVKADFVANKNHLSSLSRKERKQLKHNIIGSHLDSFSKKFIFFFADLFGVLLFVVVVRSFMYEPFIIPSGSMKPGLQISDIVLVNKYEKGLRLPVTNQRVTKGDPIERGDVIVFKYPNDPKISYIKRVIGLPGDKVFYDNRDLTINGKLVAQHKQSEVTDAVEVETYSGKEKRDLPFTILTEELPGKTHTIRYANNFKAPYAARQWVVPKGKYFVMGDNRDSSADGRAFGFLDDDLIIGKAGRIVLNVDCLMFKGKCDRFFKEIK